MIRTITSAIDRNRIAHAFLLTGIRGVGKTTTARIIAKALNCIGKDGQGGPTAEPCGECEHCTGIAEDRHMDVIEMDAASHTGVGDIRELIETVHYMPASARYKVYIIDEVHMLSNSAFNALLKTLEEPPPHVKFIFATTETRKIPVTILSRCQRFDLRRVEAHTLAEHLATICKQENAQADPEALALIAGAAEGSVRDALSLLDQAMAHSESSITANDIHEMLGLADHGAIYELLEHIFAGKTAEALDALNHLYAAGADPLLLLQDMLEAVHFITRLKVVPSLKDDPSLPEVLRSQGHALAEKLSMPAVSRAWQMLLKGVEEAKNAPLPLTAVEMTLIRLAYAADLPTPDAIIRQLKEKPANAPASSPSSTPSPSTSATPRHPVTTTATAHALQAEPFAAPQELETTLHSFEEVVALFEEHKEILLCSTLRQYARVVSFADGRIELENAKELPDNFCLKFHKPL